MNNHSENLLRPRIRPSLFYVPFSPWLVHKQEKVPVPAKLALTILSLFKKFLNLKISSNNFLIRKKKIGNSWYSFFLSPEPLLTFHPFILIYFNIRMVYICLYSSLLKLSKSLQKQQMYIMELSRSLMVYRCSCVRMQLTSPYSFYFRVINGIHFR